MKRKRGNPFKNEKCHKGNPFMGKCTCSECIKENKNPYTTELGVRR